ncbi:MAG: hypothetical protein KC488_16075, partial [Candidatus Cloacimonetes bacterium]|nr:hypothetical protein [Candidatus Cloacimonadota bacterium]
AAREARAAAAVIQPRYTAWREQLPEIRVPDDPAPTTEVLGDRRYRASELQPFFGLVLPLPGGVAGLLVLMDPLAHNTLSLYGAATDGHSLDGGYGFSLSNLQTSWVLGLNGSWHWDPAFTVYDGQLEELSSSSLEAWARRKWQYPFGLRGSLAAGLGLRVEDTEASDLVSTGGERPLPQGGRSSRVAGGLQWSSAPADRLSRLWPDWAHGLRIEGALLRPWLNGEENVNLLTLQVYRIQPTFLPSLKLVALAGAQVLSGRKDTWRSLGLSADPLLEPLAELSQLGSPLAEAPLGPLWRLRGLNRDLAADRVLYSTIELRQTLGAPDVFNLVGLRNGRLNLATFADLGQLAHRERLGAGLKDPLSLWTSGLELQLGLRGSGSTLFSLAGGYAGNKLEWLDRGDAGRWYWKFHLGRPF